MNSDFKNLQNKWDNSKRNLDSGTVDFDKLFSKIKKKEKENYFFYYGTITILLLTLIGISLFFYHVAPVEETLSRIGAGLMISGLVFRIVVEVISIGKAKQINFLDNSLKTAENTIDFHKFRKSIHKIVAPIIIALYTIGFYMITPEFSTYLESSTLIFFDISYVVIGIFLFIVIRKGVKKEMNKLAEIIELKKEITE